MEDTEASVEGSVHLRLATMADFAEMHRVRLAVLENRLRNASSIQARDYESILGHRGRGWVAELDGRVIGFAVADLSRSSIWALFVAPEAERRGIGRRLHDAMLEWVFSAGAKHVWLTTESGTRAEGFYGAAGWLRAGLEPSGEVRFTMSREQWLAGTAR